MTSIPSKVVILGTGGTIAGTAASATDSLDYRAAQRDVQDLLAAVPALAGLAIECEQLAQIDSKDLDFALWQALAGAVQRHRHRHDVAGLVITHGTDTLEETAFFLHRVLGPGAPVVLTAAMRPANALMPDGPQNLLDAVTLARTTAWPGVVAVLGGQVFAADQLRKQHGWRIDAFGGGDVGPLGRLQDGVLQRYRDLPPAVPHAAASRLPADAALWPRVDIVTSHAGATGAGLDALVADGAQGIVIAGTGNGSVHHGLLDAAQRAIAAGVPVVRASRSLLGGVFGAPQGALPCYGALTPYQARIELMLDLLTPR